MAAFTLAEFRTLVGKCFDAQDVVALDEAAVSTEFKELGYDSIGVYEIAVRVQDEYGVDIPDEDFERLTTPAAFIAYVDARVANP